jgi:hypothetical protein
MSSTPLAANTLNFIKYAYEMFENNPDNLSPPPPPDFPTNYTILANLTAVNPWAGREFFGFLTAPKDLASPSILAVRGTDGIPDWMNNFDLLPADFVVPNTWVAGGFSNLYTTLQWTAPGAGGAPVELKSMLAKANAGVAFAGHSLGGAIVTMMALALWYQNPPRFPFTIYTAASPAVGCSNFAQQFNQVVPNSSRFINDLDLVAGSLDAIYTQVNSDGIPLFSADIFPTPGCEHSLFTYLWLIDPKNYSLAQDCSWLDAARREVFATMTTKRRAARAKAQPA